MTNRSLSEQLTPLVKKTRKPKAQKPGLPAKRTPKAKKAAEPELKPLSVEEIGAMTAPEPTIESPAPAILPAAPETRSSLTARPAAPPPVNGTAPVTHERRAAPRDGHNARAQHGTHDRVDQMKDPRIAWSSEWANGRLVRVAIPANATFEGHGEQSRLVVPLPGGLRMTVRGPEGPLMSALESRSTVQGMLCIRRKTDDLKAIFLVELCLGSPFMRPGFELVVHTGKDACAINSMIGWRKRLQGGVLQVRPVLDDALKQAA